MRRVLLAILLLGCTKTKTTATGPLGDVDFSAKVPKLIAPAAPKTFEGTQTICNDDGRPGADVKVTWTVVEDGPNAYVTKAHFDLVRVGDGLEVKGPSGELTGGRSLTPNAPWRAEASTWFACKLQTFRYSLDGGGRVVFDVEGKIVPPRR